MPPEIRAATLADAEALLAIYAPYIEGTPISFETEVPTLTAFAGRIAAVLSSLPWLVCESEAGILGYAYATPHGERAAYRWGVDVSVYLAPAARGRGLGKRLYGELFEHLRALGYYKAFAGISLPNPASVGLHEAMGFTPVGVYREVGYKFGAWHDVGWWQLALRPPQPEPAEPLRFKG